MSLTYQECKDQYNAMKRTFDYINSQSGDLKDFYRTNREKSLIFTGCGSGYCLAQSFEFMARVHLGACASSVPAGDLMIHHERYARYLEGSMLIIASRSGSTTEVINAVKLVKAKNDTPVLSITCVEDSDLARISDFNLCLPWAHDDSVCQTRNISNLYAALVMIMGCWGNDTGLIRGLAGVISLGNNYMDQYEQSLAAIARLNWKHAVVLADGEIQGIAHEGALAFMEIAQTPANYYHLLDSRHGPIVMIGQDTLVIACLTSDDYQRQVDLIHDIVKKGAQVVVYTDIAVENIDGVKLHISSGVELAHTLRGIPLICIAQIIAYYRAVETGVNPDQPAGLDPWIKLVQLSEER